MKCSSEIEIFDQKKICHIWLFLKITHVFGEIFPIFDDTKSLKK
jgi:hypothetical protein